MKKIMRGKRGERGNVMVFALAGISMSVVLGFMTFSLLSGPISTMKRLDTKLLARNQVLAISLISIMDSSNNSDGASGDCDGDGLIEPRQGRDSGLGTPVEYVPNALGAPITDPWGNNYYYCVWDTGALRGNAACGVSAQRATGSPDPQAGLASTQTVLAVFSAGADGAVNSACINYVDASTAVFTCSGDDICQSYTYNQAASTGGSFWSLKTGAPDTGITAKKIEIGTGAGNASIDTTTGASDFTSLATTGKTVASGGLKVANDTVVTAGDCAVPADAGKVRYNISGGAGNETMELCDGTAWGPLASGGGGGTGHWISDGASNIYHDANPAVIGATSLISSVSKSGIFGTTNPGLELYAYCASSAACDSTLDFEHTGGTIAVPGNIVNTNNYDLGALYMNAYYATGTTYTTSMILGSSWPNLGAFPGSTLDLVIGDSGNAERLAMRIGADYTNHATGAPTVEFSAKSPGSTAAPAANLVIGLADADFLLDSNTSTTAANASNLILRRGRGTAGSPSAVSSGDALGGFNFQGASDSNTYRAAGIEAIANGTITTSSIPTDLVFYNGVNSTGYPFTGYEAMRITSAGNIGINYSAPVDAMNVNGILRITDSGAEAVGGWGGENGSTMYYRPEKNVFRMGYDSTTWQASSKHGFTTWGSGQYGGYAKGNYSFTHSIAKEYSSGDYSYILGGNNSSTENQMVTGNFSYCLACENAGSRNAVINGNFNFGAGGGLLTSASAHHSVNLGLHNSAFADSLDAPYGYVFGGRTKLTSAAISSVGINLASATADMTVAQPYTLSIMNGKVGVGGVNATYVLYVNGTAGLSTGTVWTVTSDARLKDIHSPYKKGINEIAALEPVKYRYKKNNPLDLPSDKENTGFIAQDVQKIFPEAVHERENGYLDFDMGPVNVAMVGAIKDLDAEQKRLLSEQERLAADYAKIKGRYADLKREAATMVSAESRTISWYAIGIPFMFLCGIFAFSGNASRKQKK